MRELWGLLILLASYTAGAQNCYQPILGSNVIIDNLKGGADDIYSIIDSDLTNSTVRPDVSSGTYFVSVKNTQDTYSGRNIVGFGVRYDLNLFQSKLAGFELNTYLNNEKVDSAEGSSIASTLVALGSQVMFISFATDKEFDEIELRIKDATSPSQLDIFYAFRHLESCGFLEKNGACHDMIQQPATDVYYSFGETCTGCTINHKNNLVDGNAETAAQIHLKSDVGTLTMSVLSTSEHYPAGNLAGFVLETSANFTTDLLEAIELQLFSHNSPVDTASFRRGNLYVERVDLQSNKYKISTISTSIFNELRISFQHIPLTQNIQLYDAFEEPPTCTECETIQPLVGSAFGGLTIYNDGTESNQPCELNNIFNLIDHDISNYTELVPGGALSTCKASLAIETGALLKNAVIGFAVKMQGKTFDLGLLKGMSITSFEDGNLISIQSGSQIKLYHFDATSGLMYLGMPSESANQFRLKFDFAKTFTLGETIEVYHAFALLDEDQNNEADCASTLLPIQLTKLIAERQDNEVHINWETAWEQDVERFEVVHLSPDGLLERSIQTLLPTGSISLSANYHAIDHLPNIGHNYYQLRTIDLDGKVSFSEIKVVEIHDRSTLFAIYPNPTSDFITIEHSKEMHNFGKLELSNLSGQEILQQSLKTDQNSTTISLSHLPAATYLLKIKTAGTLSIEKIVKY